MLVFEKKDGTVMVKFQLNGNQIIAEAKEFESIIHQFKKNKKKFLEHKFKEKTKPKWTECIPFDYERCEECGELHRCEFILTQLRCPNCDVIGFTAWANEHSGWNFYCSNCEKPYNSP